MTTNTDIKELARQLRESAITDRECRERGDGPSDEWSDAATTENILLILDALEAAQKRIKELEASQLVAPEGWKLVPIEATRAIIDAFKASWEKDDSYAEYWERMVRAAPALQEDK